MASTHNSLSLSRSLARRCGSHTVAYKCIFKDTRIHALKEAVCLMYACMYVRMHDLCIYIYVHIYIYTPADPPCCPGCSARAQEAVCMYVRMYVCMHDIYLQTLLVVLDVRRKSTLHVCVCVCVCVCCVCV